MVSVRRDAPVQRKANGKYEAILRAAIKVFAGSGFFNSKVADVARHQCAGQAELVRRDLTHPAVDLGACELAERPHASPDSATYEAVGSASTRLLSGQKHFYRCGGSDHHDLPS